MYAIVVLSGAHQEALGFEHFQEALMVHETLCEACTAGTLPVASQVRAMQHLDPSFTGYILMTKMHGVDSVKAIAPAALHGHEMTVLASQRILQPLDHDPMAGMRAS